METSKLIESLFVNKDFSSEKNLEFMFYTSLKDWEQTSRKLSGLVIPESLRLSDMEKVRLLAIDIGLSASGLTWGDLPPYSVPEKKEKYDEFLEHHDQSGVKWEVFDADREDGSTQLPEMEWLAVLSETTEEAAVSSPEASEIVLPEHDSKDITAIQVASLVIDSVEKFLLREEEVDISSEAMADILEDRFSKVMSLYRDTMSSDEDLEKMASNAAIVLAKCAKKRGWLIDVSNQETEASLSTGCTVTSTKLTIMGIEVSTTLKIVSSDGKVVLHTNSKEYACELIATMQAVFGECHKD